VTVVSDSSSWPRAVRDASACGRVPPPDGLRDWSVVVEELLDVHVRR
jgi:hypothetical protein